MCNHNLTLSAYQLTSLLILRWEEFGAKLGTPNISIEEKHQEDQDYDIPTTLILYIVAFIHLPHLSCNPLGVLAENQFSETQYTKWSTDFF